MSRNAFCYNAVGLSRKRTVITGEDNFLKNQSIYIYAILVAFIGLNILSAGCVSSGNVNSNLSQTNLNATGNAVNTNSAPVETAEQVAAAPLTLPVLDAMFVDEAFVNEVKLSGLITDEQLQKLKNTSRNAVLSLNETNSGDVTRSTQTSVIEAEEKIREILGSDKTPAFLAFVRSRWAGSDWNALAAAKPNAIPTDTRIIVNTPAFRMDIFENGKLRKSYKIGIGYPEFPIPTGLRHARTVIFNPTWTPPDEPWVKGDILPGKKVEAGSKLNPLGPIKIPIGYPSLIHGGKSADRLGNFASHGCVGLTNVQIQDFTKEITSLSGTELTQKDIAEYAKAKTETKDVILKTPIPVELRYETIVVENGKLKIYRDVYERGTNSEDELRRVLQTFDVSFDDLAEPERVKILAGLKQMAYEPKVNSPTTVSNSNANVSNSTVANTNTNVSNPNGKVTRNIKGKKEIVFAVNQLKGKGYPAPVGMK